MNNQPPAVIAQRMYNACYQLSSHSNSIRVRNQFAKEHAIEWVNEIIKTLPEVAKEEDDHKEYWEQVKTEIEKL